MTRRTTRIAALGAGAFMALGFFSAAPAGATDGAQADAQISANGVSAEATDLINQTLGLVNQACNNVSQVGGAAASAVTSTDGISVAAAPAGQAVNLDVSLPKLTGSLPALDSLPVVGGLLSGLTGQSQGQGQVNLAQPLQVACDTTANGTGALSMAGVEALVNAIVPGVDIASLGLDLPALGVSGEATTGAVDPGTKVSATAATQVPAAVKATASSPSVRASAAAPATRTQTAASTTPAPASGGIVAQTVGSPGALARTGAGVGALGLLGTALFGGGRLLAFSRKFLRIG
jgi:hypothetical protein